MEFNKEGFAAFRADFSEIITELEGKHNVKINIGNITYDQSGTFFNTKMTVTQQIINGVTPEENIWNQYHNLFDLKRDWFGRTIAINSKSLKIVGIDPKKRTKPVKLIDGKGGKFTTSAQTVRNVINSIIEL